MFTISLASYAVAILKALMVVYMLYCLCLLFDQLQIPSLTFLLTKIGVQNILECHPLVTNYMNVEMYKCLKYNMNSDYYHSIQQLLEKAQ